MTESAQPSEPGTSRAADLHPDVRRQFDAPGRDEPAAPPWRVLAIEVDSTMVAIPLEQISELALCDHITPVPLTRRWMRGVTSLRGQLLTVIDLAAFLGCRQTRLSRDARLLVPRERGVGALLVNRVLGLRQFEPDLAEEPVEATGPLAAYVSRVVVKDGVSWHVFDVGRLVRDGRFKRVSRCAA